MRLVILHVWIALGVRLLVPGPAFGAEKNIVSFDLNTGVTAVDYASYLVHHDLVYRNASSVAEAKSGTPLGTGRVGSLIWTVAGGLSMQITNVDASPQTSLSQGIATFKTTPDLDSSANAFEQRLNLYDGMVTTTYTSPGSAKPDRRITFFGDMGSATNPLRNELVGIHVEDSRSNVTQATFELHIWDPSKIQNYGFKGPGVSDFSPPAPPGFFHLFLTDPRDWQEVTPLLNSADGVTGLRRGDHDYDGFGYTLAASVQGTAATVSIVDGSPAGMPQRGAQTVRITMNSPAKSFTMWIACVSRKNSTSGDTWLDAEALISRAKADGYAQVLKRFRDGWRTFWSKSFVRYRGGGADTDILENLYYLSQYLIAGGSQATYPMHLTSTPYRFQPADPLSSCQSGAAVCSEKNYWWSGAYTHFNQRNLNNWMLASNHAELMDPYLNMYGGTINGINRRSALEINAIFNSEGGFTCGNMPAGSACLMVPEYTRFNGSHGVNQGGLNKRELSTSVEVAENMYLRYLYNPQGLASDSPPGSTSFLHRMAYPFMKDVANFFTYGSDNLGPVLAWDGNDWRCAAGGSESQPRGCYHVTQSNALEDFPTVGDDAPTLAGLRVLLPWVISEGPGHGDSTQEWSKRLAHLADLPISSDDLPSFVPFRGYPDQNHPSSNFQNPEMEIIYPHGAISSSEPKIQRAWMRRSYRADYGDHFIWNQDAIDAARLGLGDESAEALSDLVQTNFRTNRDGQALDNVLNTDPDCLSISIVPCRQNGRMEPNGIIISAMNEQLLSNYQSSPLGGYVIEVFPALPSAISTSTFTLAAKGGFLVSSQYEKGAGDFSGTIQYVGLKSQYGGSLSLKNPWQEPACLKRAVAGVLGGTCLASVDAGAIMTRMTSAGEILVLERTAAGRSFSNYLFSREGRYFLPNTSGKASSSVYLGDSESVTLPSNEPPFNEMIVWNYDFDEGAGCTVNNRGDIGGAGAVVGKCTFSPLVNGGTGLSFDGATYVEIPQTVTADSNITRQLAVDLWVNPSSSSGFRRLVDKVTPFTADGWLVDLTPANQVRFVACNPTMNIATTNASLSQGRWSHVRAVFDSAAEAPGMTIFLDGVAQAVNGTTLTSLIVLPNSRLSLNTNTLRIGGDHAEPVGEMFTGLIDDVLILNHTRPLDAGQTYMGDRRPALTLLQFSPSGESKGLKYADDGTGFLYTASLLGSAATWASQGIRLGTAGFGSVQIPVGETAFDLVKDQLSIDVMVYPNARRGSELQRILDRWSPETVSGFYMEITPAGKIHVVVGTRSVTSTNTIVESRWNPVSIIYTPTKLTVKLSGRSTTSTFQSSFVRQNPLQLILGADQAGERVFNGYIKDLIVRNFNP